MDQKTAWVASAVFCGHKQPKRVPDLCPVCGEPYMGVRLPCVDCESKEGRRDEPDR